MQFGAVVGHATATVKHKGFVGSKLLVVQPLRDTGETDGDPILAIDQIGSGPGMKVIISSDGKAARQAVGSKDSPVRWLVVGVVDG
ncbi:MAG: EutN/CcmL family microcompartment protein [Planctomycetota bacterium]